MSKEKQTVLTSEGRYRLSYSEAMAYSLSFPLNGLGAAKIRIRPMSQDLGEFKKRGSP